MELKIIKPFGPSIVKIKIRKDIVDKLNIYVDKLLENEKKFDPEEVYKGQPNPTKI